MQAIDWIALGGTVATVTGLVAFVGIVLWAYAARRREAFDAAARAPFALDDEIKSSAGSTTPRGPA
jgi:cbb3-type cytochrome oxidase subunit 3